MATQLGGAAEVSYKTSLIPADMINSLTFHIEEGTRTAETLAGTFESGNGAFIVNVVMSLYIPSMDWLGKNILVSRYNAGATTGRPGNVLFSTALCNAVSDSGKLNIHYVCDNTDKNDIYLPNANVRLNTDVEYNSDDPLLVELTFSAQSNDAGLLARLGTGNLTADAHYDRTTGATVVNA